MFFFQLPLLPELWFRARSHFGLRKLWRNWSPGHTPDAQAFGSLVATFSEPGETRRDGMGGDGGVWKGRWREVLGVGVLD